MKLHHLILIGTIFLSFSTQAVEFESDGSVKINKENCNLAQECLNDLNAELDDATGYLEKMKIKKEIDKIMPMIQKCVKKGFLS
ncbi:MAG: hypothetical protein Q8L85_01735 [Alphaproteobacteria bacterium]|nr:hypothetical protein [Alphaproteobacteria bacterium]